MANSYGGDAKDTTGEAFRKLFIGGLHLKTDEDGLRSFFGQWGELDDVVVMRDRNTKKSRGFGFVTYRCVEEVDEAQAHRPHIIDNKEVETKRPAPRDEGDEAKLTSKKIFVAKLPKTTTQKDLKDYFQQYGNVIEANIVMAQDTGESKGFGFVTFDDYDAVDKIILYKPHVVGNTQIEVKKGLTKDQMKELKDKQAAQQSGYGAMQNANGGMYGTAGPGTNFSGFPAAYAAAYPTVQPTNYSTGYGGIPTANNYGGYQTGGAVPQAPTGYTNFDASGGFGGPAMGSGYHPNAAYTNQGYNAAPPYGGVQPSYNPGGYNESGYQDNNAYGGANNYNASQRGGSSSSRGARGGPRGGGGRGRGGWSGQ